MLHTSAVVQKFNFTNLFPNSSSIKAGTAAIGNDSAAIKCGTNSGRINATAAELFTAIPRSEALYIIVNTLYKNFYTKSLQEQLSEAMAEKIDVYIYTITD